MRLSLHAKRNLFGKIKKRLSKDKERTKMKISIASIYNWYRQTIRNPKYRWWIILGTLVYLLSPFDISPDFIPIVGEIDDIMLATLLVTELSQLVLEKFKSSKNPVTNAQTTATGTTIDVEAVSTNKS
jgi:uncharacterized membrane protein YkvA (DUF1232 family)